MRNATKRLGDAELEIMQIIWQAGKEVTAGYILERLQKQRDWMLSTLMTALGRLVEKGFLSCRRPERNNLYTPLISQTEYQANESRTFLEKLFGNSLPAFVTALYDSKAIRREDVDELRRFLDDFDNKEDS